MEKIVSLWPIDLDRDLVAAISAALHETFVSKYASSVAQFLLYL